jgi:hypothetical protein
MVLPVPSHLGRCETMQFGVDQRQQAFHHGWIAAFRRLQKLRNLAVIARHKVANQVATNYTPFWAMPNMQDPATSRLFLTSNRYIIRIINNLQTIAKVVYQG